MTQAPTSRASFDNPTSQEERAKLLREQRTINTRTAMTELITPSAGGRFAKALGEYTVGATPTVEYPKLPDGSPWRQQQPPPEEPLGFSVEEMPVMGEPWEAERAAEIAAAGGGSYSSPPSGSVADDPSALPGLSATAASPDAASVATDAPGEAAPLGSSDPSSFTPADQNLPSPSTPADAPGQGPDALGSNSGRGAGTFSTWRRFGR